MTQSLEAQLTDEQRETLDAAEQILIGLLHHEHEVLMFSLHNGWKGISTTYFDPYNIQHGSIWLPVERPTLSDKIAEVLRIKAEALANADRRKAGRIEQLRKELDDLTAAPMGEVA